MDETACRHLCSCRPPLASCRPRWTLVLLQVHRRSIAGEVASVNQPARILLSTFSATPNFPRIPHGIKLVAKCGGALAAKLSILGSRRLVAMFKRFSRTPLPPPFAFPSPMGSTGATALELRGACMHRTYRDPSRRPCAEKYRGWPQNARLPLSIEAALYRCVRRFCHSIWGFLSKFNQIGVAR